MSLNDVGGTHLCGYANVCMAIVVCWTFPARKPMVIKSNA